MLQCTLVTLGREQHGRLNNGQCVCLSHKPNLLRVGPPHLCGHPWEGTPFPSPPFSESSSCVLSSKGRCQAQSRLTSLLLDSSVLTWQQGRKGCFLDYKPLRELLLTWLETLCLWGLDCQAIWWSGSTPQKGKTAHIGKFLKREGKAVAGKYSHP